MIEFSHFTGLDIDQMLMMLAGLFVTGAPVAEFQPFNNPGFFQQLYSAIDSCNGNGVVLLDRAPIEFINIRVILGIADHTNNHLSLAGHADAFLEAS